MRKSQFVARGGMLTAVAIALLYLASVLPTGQLGVCAAAGIIPAMPLSRKRVALGGSIYAATLVLGWLIVPQKSVVFAYTVFGLYSFVKYLAERFRSHALEWFCKLLYCNGSLLLIFVVIRAGLFPSVTLPQGIGAAALMIGFNLVFIAFDIAFSKLITLLRRLFPVD